MNARAFLDMASGFVSSNRKQALFMALACAFFFVTFFSLNAFESKLSKKKAGLERFERMRAEYAAGLAETDRLGKRLDAPGSPASALDALQSIAAGTAIKKNISQMKPYDAGQIPGFRQSGVELTIEGADIGQVVNFLQDIENSPQVILMDEFSMRPSFEDRNRLEIRARVRLVARDRM